MHPRWRRLSLVCLPLVAASCLLAWRGRVAIEARAETYLRRAGLTAGEVRFSWLGPLRLAAVSGPAPGGGRLTIDSVEVRWRLRGNGEARTHVTGVALRGIRVQRAPLAASWDEADLDVVAWEREAAAERVTLRQRLGEGELTARWPPVGAEPVLSLTRLDLGAANVHWNGEPVLSPGRWSGRLSVERTGARLQSRGTLHGDGVRVTPPPPLHTEGGEGAPATFDVDWTLRHDGRAIEIEHFSARLTGFDVSAHGVVQGSAERQADVKIEAHCDLAEAFRTAGLAPPLAEARSDHFGRASLDLSLRGPLADPAALVIEPRLHYEAEPEVLQALSYLRGPFPYRPASSPGLVIDVREGAPAFIPVEAVPHFFQKALLVSEDAGFNQHAGIDVAEIAVAWAENEQDGRRLRGASTITQQLVKNLFLSSEKTYGRKLREAALALMVDAAVPKARLLEIYLNIIEWGPGLHGLAPAAQHYFGKRPGDLTPKETAFLVCLIPNPVRYHQAHEQGRLGPGMEQLVHNLLRKLHSLGELDDGAYEDALHEELQFAPEMS